MPPAPLDGRTMEVLEGCPAIVKNLNLCFQKDKLQHLPPSSLPPSYVQILDFKLYQSYLTTAQR